MDAMIVSINQPAYLPWLGYFERIASSDLHIVLDHVQFEKNSFTNRNKVRTREGWTWLTVPLRTSGSFGDLAIEKVQIAPGAPWAKKHLRTLVESYARAPHFEQHRAFIESVYARPWEQLAPLLREMTGYFVHELGIETGLLYSSELSVSGSKSELVLNLCKQVGARTYLSGALGRGYLDEGSFAQAGIEVRYQEYRHPSYPQAFPGFEAYMGIIDLLANCGPQSLAVLTHAADAKDGSS
jgi:hypothetical protein